MSTVPNAPAPRSGGLDTRAVLAATALALVAIPFTVILVLVRVQWAPLMRVDASVHNRLHRYAVAHDGFVAAMQLISDLGSARAWLVVFTPVVIWLLWRRLPRLALFVAFTAAASALVNALVKRAVDRPRPSVVDPVLQVQGLSFPSGHAQAAVVGYGLLLFVFLPKLRGRWRIIALALAALMVLAIGFSRIALGVHYVSDVVGGYVLGAAWLTAMAAAFNVTRGGRGSRKSDPPEGT